MKVETTNKQYLSYLIADGEYYPARSLSVMLHSLLPEWHEAGILEDTGAIREFPELNNVNLIVADLDLPDGKSLDALLDRRVSVPVIFIDAYGQIPVRIPCLNIVDCIKKPVAINDLSDALFRLSGFHGQTP